MPGKLRCDAINLNEPLVVQKLLETLIMLAHNDANFYELKIQAKYYFTIPNNTIASDAGWYIICDSERHPIYVGTTTNLNNRLNTKNGSRDNFANPQRTSDDARNFIKAFFTDVIHPLGVITISEAVLCQQIGVPAPLSKRDRENIEKVLSIFRVKIIG